MEINMVNDNFVHNSNGKRIYIKQNINYKEKTAKQMKVYGCKSDIIYGGGLILVAANSKEEAYLTAAYDDKTSCLFDWSDDDDIWCNPDGNINYCTSDTYPLEKWHEVEYLSTDLSEPQIIVEDHYTE